MHNDLKKISVSAEEISAMNKRIGEAISRDFKDKNPLFIGLLKGCIPFMPDMLKYVLIPCTIDYVRASSYEGTKTTGDVRIHGHIPNVEGRHVIIVDDIIDTGRTLEAIRRLFLERGALTVTNCVLLDKPEGRVIDITPAYVGGLVPNEFVVGYGLDYNERYRNLPYIGVLKEEVYKK